MARKTRASPQVVSPAVGAAYHWPAENQRTPALAPEIASANDTTGLEPSVWGS
jgi:hypothetical protein